MTGIQVTKMSEEPVKYEHEVGFVKKYVTQYTWTLNDWYLLYDLLYKKGISSSNFNLNGTDGNTCRMHLKPEIPEKSLSLEFLDTAEIAAMTLNLCIGNTWWPNVNHYSKPLRAPYSLELILNKYLSNSTVTTDANNALVIVCKITIVKVSDTVNLLNPTVRSGQIRGTSNPPRNILANFKTMFDRKAFCDVTLVLGDKKLHAHKAVLAAQSKVFEAMFSSGMKERNANTIEISNFDVKVFEQFLNYLYGGEEIQLEEMVEEMIVIADFYNVSDLKMTCENIMLKTLSENSAIRYVILAYKINCDTLKTAALDLIRKSSGIIEKAVLEGDAATMRDLKEILSENQRES